MANAYYWNSAKWEVNQDGIGKEIHPLVALMASAMLGGLFVVFLPFIGLYLFGKHVATMIANPVKALFSTAATPMPLPGEAHLTGTPGEKGETQDGEISELAAEIESRRNT